MPYANGTRTPRPVGIAPQAPLLLSPVAPQAPLLLSLVAPQAPLLLALVAPQAPLLLALVAPQAPLLPSPGAVGAGTDCARRGAR